MIDYHENGRKELRHEYPVASIIDSNLVEGGASLLNSIRDSVSFGAQDCAFFKGKGAWILLDFSKEICGGIRLITRSVNGEGNLRITFGESVSEACSNLGEKDSSNDHSPRDIMIKMVGMSDLTFGQTGFRFARIEVVDDSSVAVQSIFAVSVLPYIEEEAVIITDDLHLNQIIKTAAYTLKLNFQNGYIWDGIKRDRLVWCGDLHPEILTSLYLFGESAYGHIERSLTFLRTDTPEGVWINTIPAYSAWWVVNLCDYCKISGNEKFFEENFEYARKILTKFDRCVSEDGTMDFGEGIDMPFFLDWPTYGTSDAVTGTAALLCWMSKKLLEKRENDSAKSIIKKLSPYLDNKVVKKQTRAFQILAGSSNENDVSFFEDDGADGMSTFMAYYILTADSIAGGNKMLAMIKEYYGGMLSRGATTFWEDFDLSWLKGSGRIDEYPKNGVKDIHGDFGRFCYKGLRHSLCHGWSSGVISFIVEYIIGIEISDGFKKISISPNMLGLKNINASIPTPYGMLSVNISNDIVKVDSPKEIEVLVNEKTDCSYTG